MSVIYILLTVSVIIGVAFFIVTPSVRMLFEDELVKKQTKPSTNTTTD